MGVTIATNIASWPAAAMDDGAGGAGLLPLGRHGADDTEHRQYRRNPDDDVSFDITPVQHHALRNDLDEVKRDLEELCDGVHDPVIRTTRALCDGVPATIRAERYYEADTYGSVMHVLYFESFFSVAEATTRRERWSHRKRKV